MSRRLRLLEVARAIADDVNDLIDHSRPRLFHCDQLREAAGSIASNIREAFGRKEGPDRQRFFVYARGSAEETDERVRANYAAGRVTAKRYWRIQNRAAVAVKMLNWFIGE